jgi:chaperonin GroES
MTDSTEAAHTSASAKSAGARPIAGVVVTPSSRRLVAVRRGWGWCRLRQFDDRTRTPATPVCHNLIVDLKPLEDRIIIRPTNADETTPSGLRIPDTAKERPQLGSVLAVGPGNRSATGQLVPLEVKVGDNILYSKYGGTEVVIDGEDLLILTSRDVLAVMARDVLAVMGSAGASSSGEDSRSRLLAAPDGEEPAELAWLPERATLYMDTTDRRAALRLVAAVEQLFDAYDVAIERDGPLRAGSLRQRFGLGNAKEVSQKIVDGVAAQLAGVPQAEANLRRAQAAALLVEQARDPAIPNMVLECEDFVLVKVTPHDGREAVIVVKQLTALQKELLAQNADWTMIPARMLQLLSSQTVDAGASTVPELAPAADSEF